MITNSTPIRKRVQSLLTSQPQTMANWSRLVQAAAERTHWPKRTANARPGVSFYIRFGTLAATSNAELKVCVRYRGCEVGTLTQDSGGNSPKFVLNKPAKTESALTKILAALKEQKPPLYLKMLSTGCRWNSPAVASFFKCLTKLKSEKPPTELAIEEAIISSLRSPKRFWFPNTALVQKTGGASFPYKFTVPVVVKQGNGRLLKAAQALELIQPTSRYGYPDILLRSEGVLSGDQMRLCVMELKKPEGHAEVALLQAYAYALALEEALKLWQKECPLRYGNLRRLLGYPKRQPDSLRFAAYAVVEQREVSLVRDNNALTSAVLDEAGEDVQIGILGYELTAGGVRLSSAVRRVNGEWMGLPFGTDQTIRFRG